MVRLWQCVHLDVDALWPAMNGIANVGIQCLTSSKVTSSESRRSVSSTLACAMSSQPAPPTIGRLFFSYPHEAYISQNVTHCLQFVFLFALFPHCFEQPVTDCFDVFYLKDQLAFRYRSCYAG